MGRPLHRPTGPIRKPPHDSPSLMHLSTSLVHAARALRAANNSLNVSQQVALNTAYRHTTRTARLLHTLYGATLTHDSDEDDDDDILVLRHPQQNQLERDRSTTTDNNNSNSNINNNNNNNNPSASQSQTPAPAAITAGASSRRYTYSPSAPASFRRRDRHNHYEMLLRRAERMPRLPLPPALRESVTELAERTLQFVEQRRLAAEGRTTDPERETGAASGRAMNEASRRTDRLVGVRVLQLPPLPQVPLSRHFADVGGDATGEEGVEEGDE